MTKRDPYTLPVSVSDVDRLLSEHGIDTSSGNAAKAIEALEKLAVYLAETASERALTGIVTPDVRRPNPAFAKARAGAEARNAAMTEQERALEREERAAFWRKPAEPPDHLEPKVEIAGGYYTRDELLAVLAKARTGGLDIEPHDPVCCDCGCDLSEARCADCARHREPVPEPVLPERDEVQTRFESSVCEVLDAALMWRMDPHGTAKTELTIAIDNWRRESTTLMRAAAKKGSA